MTFNVIVMDRDAGWAVELWGPYANRADADDQARRLRHQYANLAPARGNLRVLRTAADMYEVRVVPSEGPVAA